VNDTRLYDTGDDGANEGNGEGVVDVEFERGVGVVVAVMREDIEKFADEIKAFASDV